MTLKTPITELPFLLESLKAFYIYTTAGLHKAVDLYPNASEFIERNSDKSYNDVKEKLLKQINKIDVTA